MADVYLIGLNHFLQDVERQLATEQARASEQQQREAFASRLDELQRQLGFQLVAEEAKLDRESFTFQRIQKWGVRYHNATMSRDERERLGIVGYENDPQLREKALKQFEEHMFAGIRAVREDATHILVICGGDHLSGLAEMFNRNGDRVTMEDVREAEWYRGFAVESAGRNGVQFVGNARDDREVLDLMMGQN